MDFEKLAETLVSLVGGAGKHFEPDPLRCKAPFYAER